MGLLLTLLMGLIVGTITGFLMKSNYPWYIDILLGIVGAAVGGWLTSIFLGVDLTTGFNLTTLIVSVIGAVIVVFIYRLITGRRRAV
ncbi:MAG TPA: GlsB/YeaQ/YmgE family stress response membrane protein [Chloroflexaceae bacterium]|nr:GlsB/YeaQ/YmgE family stress response membrane protein [Chloroflexaceae bacterium]